MERSADSQLPTGEAFWNIPSLYQAPDILSFTQDILRPHSVTVFHVPDIAGKNVTGRLQCLA